MVDCIRREKSKAQKQGRQFDLGSKYKDVGFCIAKEFNLVDSSGIVNKAELTQRIQSSRSINGNQRARYLGLVDTCHTWDGCLTQHCNLG